MEKTRKNFFEKIENRKLDSFPRENPVVKRQAYLSARSVCLLFLFAGIPAAVFGVAQVYILFGVSIPPDTITARVVSLVYDCTWGLIKSYITVTSMDDAIRWVHIWMMLNILLSVIISIPAKFMLSIKEEKAYIERLSNKKVLTDKEKKDLEKIQKENTLKKIVRYMIQAILHGPAYAEDTANRLAMLDMEHCLPSNSALIDDKKKRFSAQIFKAYIDTEIGGITCLLSVKLNLLFLMSLVFWILYPFVDIYRQNIVMFVEKNPLFWIKTVEETSTTV